VVQGRQRLSAEASNIAGAIETSDPFEAFAALVFQSPALQATLGAIDDPAAFVAAAEGQAQRNGIAIGAEALRRRLEAARLGLAFARPAPPAALPGWLPSRLVVDRGRASLSWTYFGGQPLREPFFGDSLAAASRRPLTRLLGFETPLGELDAWADAVSARPPDGLIFHMSRCGSTLVAQMLAGSPANTVVSEAAPLDAVAQLDRRFPAIDPKAQAQLLRSMAAVLGQALSPDQTRSFIKLDSWHGLAWPLFRRAFPGTPWVFLYREPSEVMVSQMRLRGAQTVPQLVPASLFGLEPGGGAEAYCAQVLGRICDGALEAFAGGNGLLVNYDQLPGALFTHILPHLGVRCGEDERRLMAEAARYDAKAAGLPFASDTAAKRQAVTPAIRAACCAHLDDRYARLEALREAAASRAPGDRSISR
jgi:hypothetical protein